MPKSSLIVNEIAEIGRRLYQRGMIAGTDGNISVRLDRQSIIITKSGVCKGFLTEQDFVVIDMEGRALSPSGTPSSETGMHIHVYKNRPEVSACVHAHPPYCTAFAVTGEDLNRPVLPEVALFVGEIGMTNFAFPGTPEVAASLDPFIRDHDAFLLKNHGLATTGRTLSEAWQRLETVEHFAQILFLARQLGGVEYLDNETISRLKRMRAELIARR